MSMSVDGLVSGMDTTALITQLLQAEGGPKLALQKRLGASQTSASASRTVNPPAAPARAAAEAMPKPDVWPPAKPTSNPPSVPVPATGSNPPAGSLTFTVQSL